MEEALNNYDLIISLQYVGTEPQVIAIARIPKEPFYNMEDGKHITDIQEGDKVVTFNKNSIDQLTIEGKIPQNVSDYLTAIFEDQNHLLRLSDNLNNSDNIDDANSYKQLLEKVLQRDKSNQLVAIRYLLSKKDYLEPDFNSSKIPDAFYKHIDKGRCFGVIKILTDRLRYIPELLQKLVLIDLQNTGRYMICSSMQLKDIGEIGLSYAFTLGTDQVLENVLRWTQNGRQF
ncbi:MAG TPA: hypothetical protein VGW78_03170 [Candidatus Babeliales bacterium]|nr:hypothetical protein [Candidatus Babeliales bacterium]